MVVAEAVPRFKVIHSRGASALESNLIDFFYETEIIALVLDLHFSRLHEFSGGC